MDVSHLSHPATGIGTYTRGSLAGLAEAGGGRHELIAFALANWRRAGAIGEQLDGVPVDLRVVRAPFAHAWRTGWSRLRRPAAERILGRVDVLHYWDWMYPPQRGGVRATTVSDLVPMLHPEWVTERTQQMHGAKYRDAAATCDVIFTDSHFTARDVVERLDVPEERVRVAYPGVDGRFRPDGDRAGLGRPYVLAVGTEPRKNAGILAETQRALPTGHAVAVVGEGPPSGVLGLGYVSDEELPRLYRGADVFVYPSLYEGFGIPVVEAMACGTPCVVSSHPSLDEAAGDVAVRVDPRDPAAVAAGIEQALAERDDLVRRGLEHARRFTWEATGRALLAGYEAALT
jgi:glycosyltransferase involved in cell wall biosynthesis